MSSNERTQNDILLKKIDQISMIDQAIYNILYAFLKNKGYLENYQNLPMQERYFLGLKIEDFKLINFDNFRGGSNEYPQSMFWSKHKKKRYTPAYPSFSV